MNPRPWWTTLGHRTLLVLATVYCIFPIYFMLVQSLKTAQEDVFGNPLIVVNPTLENFAELFERETEVRGFVGRVLHRSYPFTTWLDGRLASDGYRSRVIGTFGDIQVIEFSRSP